MAGKKRKIRVGVLFGGRSGEHEVSLASAKSVLNALDREKYDVVPIGITKAGRWLPAGPNRDPMALLQSHNAPVEAPGALLGDPSHHGLVLLDGEGDTGEREQLDVIVPVLHGTYGEDGTVQGLLELADIPYVGCGVLASATGMDKTVMKALFRQAGLPVLPEEVVMRHEWRSNPEAVLDRVEGCFPYPVFIKPANMGSSVGISKAHNRTELAAGLNEAAQFDRKILVEPSAPNPREIEMSVLGNDEPIVSVPGEIVPGNEFYDYNAKYIDDNSVAIIPANLPQETIARLQDYARRAFIALDGSGLARVDCFVSKDDPAVIYVNEINTMPGFTPISMYPKLWEASGIPYAELLDRLIELAFERYAEKHETQTDFWQHRLGRSANPPSETETENPDRGD